MKVAVIGSRNINNIDLEQYLPKGTDEIVSGGARGVDSCAAAYARAHGLRLTEFLPDYDRYGRGAPIRRNMHIVAYADYVLAFWDGVSPGTRSVIAACEKAGKPVKTIYN